MERSDVEPAIGASGPGIAAAVLLVLLLVGDLVYVAIHLVATGTTLLDSPLATLDVDRGYAEFFQYLKLLWACLLLACVGLRSRRWQYLAWVALFGYLLADDSLSLHENLGVVLADRLALTDAIGLRAIDFGELLVSAAAGVVLAVSLGLAYARGGDEFRRSSRDLFALLLALVFFGVVVDMAHIAVDPAGWLDNALVILEDGGEMVVGSFVTWYAFLLLMAGERRAGETLAGLIGKALSGLESGFRPRDDRSRLRGFGGPAAP